MSVWRIIYDISGLLMFAWYIGYRWTSLGNEVGKFINNGFTLNWWYAPINILTGLTSLVFVTIALFDFNYSFKLRWMYWIAFLIAGRNVWYAVLDIFDYINNPCFKQACYIILDIAMLLFALIWIHLFRSMN